MDASGRVELPTAFEQADIDNLVLLIGTRFAALHLRFLLDQRDLKADMLERLMAHNDRIPLLP
jgi:hypothetical protein